MAIFSLGSLDNLAECRETHLWKFHQLLRALSLNTLQEGVWFSLGCAAMRVEDYSKSTQAFRRKVEMDEDASCFLFFRSLPT